MRYRKSGTKKALWNMPFSENTCYAKRYTMLRELTEECGYFGIVWQGYGFVHGAGIVIY